jgi:hypothetical protein
MTLLSPRLGCLVALAILGVARDVGCTKLALAPAAADSELSLAVMRPLAAPSALPEGGYLAYRQAAPLQHEACQVSVPKEPLRGRIDRAVLLAANEQLNLPMGAGRLLTVRGRPYLFCLEPHYHPPGYAAGPEGWHKGVTVYRPAPPTERKL